MTNTSPITTTNFIAGTIGVALALVIMPEIIIGTVSASADGANRDAGNELVSDINTVCGGDSEVEGELDMDSNYRLELDDRDFSLYDPDDNRIKNEIVSCPINQGVNISNGGAYVVSSTDVDEDDDHENYDIEMTDS